MVRRVATQVASSLSRQLQAGALPQPVWYEPALNHPPTPLPPRQLARVAPALDNSSSSSSLSSSRKKRSTPKLRVPSVEYELADKVRRRFFKDFPFEALRPTTLVEGKLVDEGKGKVRGLEWKELAQHGLEPTVEDVVAFVLNLHDAHLQPISLAYKNATEQFTRLRSIAEFQRLQAEEEQWYYASSPSEVQLDGKTGEPLAEGQKLELGANEKHPSPSATSAFQRFFDLEARALDTLAASSSSSSASSSSRTAGTVSMNPPSAAAKRKAWAPQPPRQVLDAVERVGSGAQTPSASSTAAASLFGRPLGGSPEGPSGGNTAGAEFTGGLSYKDAWQRGWQAAESRKMDQLARQVEDERRDLEQQQQTQAQTTPKQQVKSEKQQQHAKAVEDEVAGSRQEEEVSERNQVEQTADELSGESQGVKP